MADTPPTPQEFPTDFGPQPANPSKLTGLLRAEYLCPECSAVVVRIEGNTLQYLQNHMYPRQAEADKDGYVSLVMHHPKDNTNIVPPKEQERPFLTIQSSVMTS
jgi:hypothetical protein